MAPRNGMVNGASIFRLCLNSPRYVVLPRRLGGVAVADARLGGSVGV